MAATPPYKRPATPDGGGGESAPHRIPAAGRKSVVGRQGTSTSAGAIARAKAPLKRDFPDWNIVHSSADRWWAFLDPERRAKGGASTRATAVEADTAEELYELLAAAQA